MLERLDRGSRTELLGQPGRVQVMIDAGQSRPSRLTTPSGSVVTLRLCLTKLADQGSVYTYIAHWAR